MPISKAVRQPAQIAFRHRCSDANTLEYRSERAEDVADAPLIWSAGVLRWRYCPQCAEPPATVGEALEARMRDAFSRNPGRS